MFDLELDTIAESLTNDNLSAEDKIKLLEESRATFEQLPGVQFNENTDDENTNILNDFVTTRNVLTKNVDRLEKITALVFDTIALMPENLKAITIGMECINAQNNNLRLLAELKSKLLTNKQLQKKLQEIENKPKGNGLPKGFTLK